jgi:hypothetical protein
MTRVRLTLSGNVRPLLAVCLVSAAAFACGDQPAADVYSYIGQYTWISLDGQGPSGYTADSAGVAISVRSGELDIGWNTPLSAYRVFVTRLYVYANGDSVVRSAVFSTGHWTLNDWVVTLSGDRLTPADSAGSGPFTGTLTYGVITVRGRDHEYQFMRFFNCGDGGLACPGNSAANERP